MRPCQDSEYFHYFRDESGTGRFFSDPLVDAARLLDEDVLSVVYPEANSPDIFVLDYGLR